MKLGGATVEIYPAGSPLRSPLPEEKIMRRRLITLTLTAMTPLCLGALVSPGSFAQQKPGCVLVHDVTSVDLSLEKRLPPNALVRAKGRVTTGGYKNPRLEPVKNDKPPADGIQDLRFCIDPPPSGGIVSQGFVYFETPILRIEKIPDWFKGVRVIAEVNKLIGKSGGSSEDNSQGMHQPCAIVCPIDTVLNKEKCTCESSRPVEPCALVCLGPDQVLDAKQCRCVNAGARGIQ